jgi:hypothetical protein
MSAYCQHIIFELPQSLGLAQLTNKSRGYQLRSASSCLIASFGRLGLVDKTPLHLQTFTPHSLIVPLLALVKAKPDPVFEMLSAGSISIR